LFVSRFFADFSRFFHQDGVRGMATDIAKAVVTAVDSLGYELVEFESSARGLLRVFIDSPKGISVEDCASVSNHLTRLFMVEGVEFERLEVSSPGLDRLLKTAADFERFRGQAAKVRLQQMTDGRRRFDGVIEAVEQGVVYFDLVEAEAVAGSAKAKPTRVRKAAGKPVATGKKISVPLEAIERARLIPEI
jgi:ribosome maturation factor RimP